MNQKTKRARAGKYKPPALTPNLYLLALASNLYLPARASKYKLGVRARGRSRGPGNTKTQFNELHLSFLKLPELAYKK